MYKMETKNLILIAAVGLGAFAAYSFLSKNNKYYVPGVGYVNITELPNYGYRNIGGKWYSQSQIDAAVGQAGGTPGTNLMPGTDIFNTVMNILGTLIPLTQNVVNLIVSATNRPQSIQAILDKYSDPNSPDFIPAFQYTEYDLQQLSNNQLQSIFDYGFIQPGITGIEFSCSDAGSRLNACRWEDK